MNVITELELNRTYVFDDFHLKCTFVLVVISAYRMEIVQSQNILADILMYDRVRIILMMETLYTSRCSNFRRNRNNLNTPEVNVRIWWLWNGEIFTGGWCQIFEKKICFFTSSEHKSSWGSFTRSMQRYMK